MNNSQLPNDIQLTVEHALAEDIGKLDLTGQLLAPETQATAEVLSRDAMCLCGKAWFDNVFKQLDGTIRIDWRAQDGDSITPNQPLCRLTGPARPMLTGERTALNFLQLLSGTATRTQHYVQAIAGTQAKVLDTRKTLPGLRMAQKYAVRCGGGYNHRMGLYDAFLIKENHILAAGSIRQAIQAARQLKPELPVEVEVETLTQIEEALIAGTQRLLLDNFSLTMLYDAVALVAGKASLEASGGVTLQTIRAIAETGVNFISVGALTKDVQAVDLSMRIQTVQH